MGTLIHLACPEDDRISAQSVLDRAAAVTCAGCHSPDDLLGTGRHVGCGLVWPQSLGEAHIDEQGHLSPALTDVFLPHRANVLATYLRACDPRAILSNLQPVPPQIIAECFIAGTPVTMADGSHKAIERVEPGDSVLSFDRRSQSLVSARVEKRFVRADTDSLIVVNGSLVATPNHEFWTARGFVSADSLAVGDTLVGARDFEAGGATDLALEPHAVTSLELRPGSVTTFNLAVAGDHVFFAGGLLVHDGP